MTSKPAPAEPVALYVEEHRLLPITLRNHLKRLVDEKNAFILTGVCKNFEDYRARCGEVRGLEQAIGICQEVEKQLSPE